MESDNWKVGDVAICVKVGRLEGYGPDGDPSDYPNLRLHTEYMVNGVRTCECGGVTLDVGLNSNSTKGTTCICGAVSRPGTGIHWCAAQRFIKKQVLEAIESEGYQEAISKAVDEENYELAGELQKQLNKT